MVRVCSQGRIAVMMHRANRDNTADFCPLAQSLRLHRAAARLSHGPTLPYSTLLYSTLLLLPTALAGLARRGLVGGHVAPSCYVLEMVVRTSRLREPAAVMCV